MIYLKMKSMWKYNVFVAKVFY